MEPEQTSVVSSAVVLRWIPVGAGGHVVRRTSAWWERANARRERRSPRALFHAALEVRCDGVDYVIEMAPAWGLAATDRGVVISGPVGSRTLGRLRLFRYEVRCWRDGTIPDRQWATEPLLLSESPAVAAALLDSTSQVPDLTWGRPVHPGGEMWNSNSVVAWLLTEAGIDPAGLRPPGSGWAPGWTAGIDLSTS